LYVDGVSGSDSNNCTTSSTACKTIGHAISLASSGDLIKVTAATYPENLTINISLNVIGSGASTTIIDGGGVAAVVTIPNSTNAHVSLSKMTIRNGFGNHGGGISNGQGAVLTISESSVRQNTVTGGLQSSALGGGIYSTTGMLTINNSIISENSAPGATGAGGGIFNIGGKMTVNNSTINGNSATVGGGIYNDGATMMINNSAISGNSASAGGGGGIVNGVAGTATLTINNSTISGNSAPTWHGGGILNTGTLRINNGTLNGNSAVEGGAILNGVHICSPRKGCKTYGTATLQNSIVANSPSGGNCSGYVPIASSGYNLSSDATCDFRSAGDLNNLDPMLGPLQNNGGPTQTMALPSGSPAIDAGNPNGCRDGFGNLLKTDQRGAPRHDPEDTRGCDIGAYERQRD